MEETPLESPMPPESAPTLGVEGIDMSNSQGTSIGNQGALHQQFGDRIKAHTFVSGDQINIHLNSTAFSESLNRLIGLLSRREALAHLAVFQDRLQRASRLIATLRDNKKLHDSLYNLQVYCLRPILYSADGFPNDVRFSNDLIGYREQFRAALGEVQHISGRLALGKVDSRWLNRLQQAEGQLSEAMDTSSKLSLDKATGTMRSEISQHLMRANEGLKAAALGLLDLHLAEVVIEVRDALALQPNGVSNPNLMNQYDEGILALTNFRDDLRARVEEHDGWQLAESELQRIESAPITDMPSNWPDLVIYVQPLVANQTEPWAIELAATLDKLQTEILTQNLNTISSAFTKLRSKAIYRFFEVDKRLLELCETLLNFGPKLDGLLSVLPQVRS